MNLAVLYAGPYRGNDLILKNHKLAFNDIAADIYVSCFEHYVDDWVNSGWDVKEYYTTPNIDFKTTNWQKYRSDSAGQSGFWQFWNLKNVIDSVPKKYDYYVKSRNDIIFNHSLTFDVNALKPNTIYSADESFHKKQWDENNWINDEFYIGCENTMKVVSNFVTNFYEKDRHSLNARLASNESQLRIWLSENNIDVKKIYNFPYTKNHNGVTIPSGYVEFQLEKI
jgi:hypothetical protein